MFLAVGLLPYLLQMPVSCQALKLQESWNEGSPGLEYTISTPTLQVASTSSDVGFSRQK